MAIKKSILKRFFKETQASFWKRLLAYLIDIFIIAFVIVLPFRRYMDFPVSSVLIENIRIPWLISILIGILTLLYFTLLEYLTSQTIGKMILDIEVKSDYGKLKFSQCLLRNIVKVSTFLLAIDSIGFIKLKKRFSDKIIGTEVVER